MARMLRLAAVAVLATVVAAATACSLVGPRTSVDGLTKVAGPGPGTLFVKTGHAVGSYDAILLRPKVGFDYAAGQEPLPPHVEQRIAERMVYGLRRGVDAQFQPASEPDPCAVQLGLWLTNLSFYESLGKGSKTSYVNSYGQATLIFEFRDSMTDEALVRYGQTARLGSGVDGGTTTGPDLRRLNRAIDVMLRNVGQKLQEVVPVSEESSFESAHGCQGKIGKAVLAARERRG